MFQPNRTPRIEYMDTKDCQNCENGTLWPLPMPGYEIILQMVCDNCDFGNSLEV